MYRMKKVFLLSICCLFLSLGRGYAQFMDGTTGLLHMPTAEMQRDKTFMVGGGYLDKHSTPYYWSYHTYNYYIIVVIFTKSML